MASTSATNPDTLVTLKINIEGSNRRFKLPLRDLGASTLPDKLRYLLAIPSTSEAVFERYSDSAASFVVLDPTNTSVYKQLYRAAKAKLKLRLKVTVMEKAPVTPKPATVEDEEPSPVSPVEEQPLFERTVEATPTPAPEAAPAAEVAENSTRTSSVSEMQKQFEDLVIKHNGFSCPVVSSGFLPGNHPTISPSMKSSQRKCPYSSAVPVTRGSAARDKWYAELAGLTNPSGPAPPSVSVYSVYCNNCNDAIPNEHYHCSTCEDGDFDLCQNCVNSGVLCGGDDHWLIKRSIENGKVTTSVTETIAPKPKPSFSESKTTLVEDSKWPATRTCNCCVEELAVEHFVTCLNCDDYDLCMKCHVNLQHGHHPGHAFAPAVEDANMTGVAQALLSPGRNAGHNAICDGCDKSIYGVRHKCLDCPDWDFCSTCMPNASFIHPRHRFVPIYESTGEVNHLQAPFSRSRHHGIFCDGPLCQSGNGAQTYIKGDRYKCAVCHDTDFCASCEASPSNPHNRTHPLIKFKTPVRNVSVTTLGDHEDGKALPVMGDRRPRSSKATETTPAQSANAATQVQTVADLQPTEAAKVEETHEIAAEKAEVKAEDVKELSADVLEEDLVAHFVSDVIADGSVIAANSVFEQTWYLHNGGKTTWPAGCSVKFVGGDNMCAVDPNHPASVHELVSAAESTTCYTEVAPGQDAGFTVLMRTPNRAGHFISYWRLTGPKGGKFGHRLWCDVNVEATPVAKEEPEEETVEAKQEPQTSQMIFPKLEKESPATSIHQEAPAPVEMDDEEYEFDELDEDLENDETEDGFLTDEEYDILDASDEEYLAEQEKAAKK